MVCGRTNCTQRRPTIQGLSAQEVLRSGHVGANELSDSGTYAALNTCIEGAGSCAGKGWLYILPRWPRINDNRSEPLGVLEVDTVSGSSRRFPGATLQQNPCRNWHLVAGCEWQEAGVDVKDSGQDDAALGG